MNQVSEVQINYVVAQMIRTALRQTVYDQMTTPANYSIVAEYDYQSDELTVHISNKIGLDVVAETVLS